MSLKELHFPKALNIIRPSSPLMQLQDSSHSSSTASSSSISSFSSISSHARIQPTIVTPSNFAYFQNNWASLKSTNTVGVNPHRFLQRPRSNSSLSKSTFFSSLSISSHGDSEDDDEDDDDEEYDLNSIDGLTDDDQDIDITDDDYSGEEYEDDDDDDNNNVGISTKIVAKIKHGTIMNGKGEFVNKGSVEDQNSWLDEARANRKIADLEIEKASLLVLNTTLEAKLRQQTSQIAELQKRLQMNEGPLTPVSDKHVDESLLFDDDETTIVSSTEDEDDLESDQVFQRIKSMLEGLILQAEVALLQKTKQSGKVLQQDQYFLTREEEKKKHVEDTLHKLTVRTSPITSPSSTSTRKSPRRVSSDSSKTSNPSSAKMTRNLSRKSSPPVMVTSTSPRPFSPPPTRRSASPRPFSPPPTRRSASPRYSSQLRKSQDLEKPKWNF